MNSQKVIDKKFIKYLKIAVVVIVIALFLWFLVIHPLFTFLGYEKDIEAATKRYYEINARELPTGTRVKTLSVQKLFNQAYLKEDFYVPFSKKPCSITESWVKVRQEDGKYKYYTYLKCGIFSSNVDHKGPEIVLNGEEKITVNLGSKYKEEGVRSVVDNADGKMDVKDVEIDSSSVNTNKAGTYKVVYSATDSLNNTNEVVRTVEVVERLKNTVSKATNKTGIYTGSDPNNYISFSGMLFRIVDIDGDDVRIVAEQDISNVNYAAIDEWLNYYYEHISEKSKKLIVKNKYCDMKTNDNDIPTIEKCSSFTKEKMVSILSANDINQAEIEGQNNWLRPNSISWIRNEKDDKNAYAVRNRFYNTTARYMSFDQNYNFGVRPVLTIKGSTLIVSGDGTKNNPYFVGDIKSAKAGDKVNTRHSGEFVSFSGMMWRIIDVDSDHTTKVIANTTVYNGGQRVLTYYDTDSKAKVYNPKERGNVGYFISNQAGQYFDTNYFVSKEIEVPIYKNMIRYGKESTKEKYKVKISAPNMYEMFSAFDYNSVTMKSYWLINSSKAQYTKASISDIGVVMYGPLYDNVEYGVRPVGYLNQDCSIVRGTGTYSDPYIITK